MSGGGIISSAGAFSVRGSGMHGMQFSQQGFGGPQSQWGFASGGDPWQQQPIQQQQQQMQFSQQGFGGPQSQWGFASGGDPWQQHSIQQQPIQQQLIQQQPVQQQSIQQQPIQQQSIQQQPMQQQPMQQQRMQQQPMQQQPYTHERVGFHMGEPYKPPPPPSRFTDTSRDASNKENSFDVNGTGVSHDNDAAEIILGLRAPV
jgi:hypothetical protein